MNLFRLEEIGLIEILKIFFLTLFGGYDM